MNNTKQDLVLLERHGGIRVLCFNSPPLNISNKDFAKALSSALAKIEQDDEAQVMILCSNGRVFSAGSDMKEILEYIEQDTYVDVKMNAEQRIRQRIEDLPVPVIAALDADAFGGGLETVLACDMRIAHKNVSLCAPEVDIGSFCGAGGTRRLVRLIGPARAMEMTLFGNKIDAYKALEWGLVNAVAEEGTARDMAMEWARRLIEKPAAGVKANKKSIRGMYTQEEAYLYQLSQQISQDVIDAGSLKKGIEDFFARKSAKKSQ